MLRSKAQRTAQQNIASNTAGVSDGMVRAVALTAIAFSASYVFWRAGALGDNLWLSGPLLVLETWGLLQISLLCLQGWTSPQPAPRRSDRTASDGIDLVVTCTYHSPGDLERTLVACRSLRNVRKVLVVMRPGRGELKAIAQSMDVEVLERDGNHVDIYWEAARSLGSQLVGWVEAGQIPLPAFADTLLPHFDDDQVAVVQSAVGLVNKDSLAHVRGGRDEHAFRRSVAFPGQSAHGFAPWHGGGSIVRLDALRSVDGIEPDDQAALERSLVQLHSTGWKSRYHHDPPLVRANAPDSLNMYLLRRRRLAIETLRVFRTPESPLRLNGLSLRARLYHLALANSFGLGLRQLGLLAVLLLTLLTGRVPLGHDTKTWALLWGPTFVAGVAARHLLARGTMNLGDWTREGWRTLGADLSAIGAVIGLHRVSARPGAESSSGWRSLGKLRALTGALLALELALVLRGSTVFWPDILPRFSASGRVLAVGIALTGTLTMIDVLQVSVRRRQRRSDFRLTTELPAKINGLPVRVIDLSPSGMGAIGGPAYPFSVGSEFDVRLGLLSATGRRLTIRLTATARSEAVTTEGPRFGFEFTAPDATARAALIEYCAIAHHQTGAGGAEHAIAPTHFDVSHSHPRAMRWLSRAAVALGLSGLFFGPASQSAFAAEAVTVSVCLTTSVGDPVGGAVASYYEASWRPLGTTGADGCVVGAVPEGKTPVSIRYEQGSIRTTQDTTTNPNITFSTVPVTVALTTSTGDPIEGAIASYYANEWKTIGTTGTDGTATIELLPNKTAVSISYQQGSIRTTQDTTTNPNITFVLTPPSAPEKSALPGDLTATPAPSTNTQPATTSPTPKSEPETNAQPAPTTSPTPKSEPETNAQPAPTTSPTPKSEPTAAASAGSAPGALETAPGGLSTGTSQRGPATEETGPAIAVELAFEDTGVSGNSGWICTATDTVLRCENSGVTATTQVQPDTGEQVAQGPDLEVERGSRLGDVAVALGALGLMWLALSVGRRLPGRTRQSKRSAPT